MAKLSLVHKDEPSWVSQALGPALGVAGGVAGTLLLPGAGTALGAGLGGALAGGAIGASAGSAVGGLGSKIIDSTRQHSVVPFAENQSVSKPNPWDFASSGVDLLKSSGSIYGSQNPLSGTTAADRRMSLTPEMSKPIITDALDQLHLLPPHLQQEYGPPLLQAYHMSEGYYGST